MPKTKNYAPFDQLRSWLQEVDGVKTADDHEGKTTHPSKDVDNGTMKPTEGAQGKDNDRYVKEHVPANVDDERHVGKEQEDQQFQIGTRKSEVGGDPSLEHSYKDRPKDPGTAHPADTSIGPKYSFDFTTSAGLNKAAAAFSELCNEVLADIAVGPGAAPAKTAGAKKAEEMKSCAGCGKEHEASLEVCPHCSHGKMAADATLAEQLGLSKEAADLAAQGVVEETVKRAMHLAERTAKYLYECQAMEKKAAEDAEEPPVDAKAGPDGGEGPPGGGMPPGLPGMPPGGDAGGPPPGADAGPPPGAGGPGGASPEQAMQELAMALMELGIDPEALAAAGKGGPGAGGPPPGGPPPDLGAPPEDAGAKVASAVKEFKRSGKFKISEAKTASERKLRDQMKSYVLEIVGR